MSPNMQSFPGSPVLQTRRFRRVLLFGFCVSGLAQTEPSARGIPRTAQVCATNARGATRSESTSQGSLPGPFRRGNLAGDSH